MEWLSSWIDPIWGKNKYIYLWQTWDIRWQNDKDKYNLAFKLKDKIKSIRKSYMDGLKWDDIVVKQ